MSELKRRLMLRWIKATSLGWFLSIVLVLVLSAGFEAAGIADMQFFMGVSMGAGVGFMQWRFLKRELAIRPTWIYASITGLGLPFFLFDLLRYFSDLQPGSSYILYSVSLAGLLTGIFQYLIFKDHSTRAILWIPVCFLGWMAATFTFLAVNYTRLISANNWVLFSINLALILIGGVVLGLVTGPALISMFEKKRLNSKFDK